MEALLGLLMLVLILATKAAFLIGIVYIGVRLANRQSRTPRA